MNTAGHHTSYMTYDDDDDDDDDDYTWSIEHIHTCRVQGTQLQ